MRGLKITMTLKIIITILFWIIPSLFFPQSLCNDLGFPKFEPLVFIKILGVAFTALCFCYIFGLSEIKKGKYPEISVRVGIVSNGGAALFLAASGIGGDWKDWGNFAQSFMWLSLISVSLITFGLCYFGVFKHYVKD